MNVTILVGNGFDLNLNLKTKYTDFIENYCGDTGGDSKDIKSFKDDIIKDCETWANAELAFGMYTINFLGSEDGAEKFCNCHDDFCENLAQYLQSQEKLLNWKFEPTSIARTFGGCISFANLVSGLLETEKNEIYETASHYGGAITYNFINFNYTKALDKFVKMASDAPGTLGERTTTNGRFNNSAGELYHVHGTTENDMVLGVNDESQIKEVGIFENYGPEYKNALIKQQTNEMNGANMDAKCEKIIKESHLIYIYGMSIGATDALWWKRIVDLLKICENAQVIIRVHDAPEKRLLKRRFLTYCDKKKKEFLSYDKSGKGVPADVLNRIHIDSSNIFEKLKIYAAPEKQEAISTVPETV